MDEAGRPDLIRIELERILASPAFAGSERRRGFLRFIVEETLNGRANRIKAYAIALQVFGRDSSFDAQTDPIVRIEAGRLRKSLKRYYDEAGRDDPVRIEIPTGTYVPNFHASDPGPEHERELPPPPSSSTPGPRREAQLWRALALAGLALTLLVGLWTLLALRQPGEAPLAVDLAGDHRSGPAVLVLPLVDLSPGGENAAFAQGVAEEIVGMLLHFDGLTVFDAGTILSDPGSVAPLDLARRLEAGYILSGNVQVGGKWIRIATQLVDAATGATLWGETFQHDRDARATLAAKSRIGSSVARTLAQPYGVIFRDALADGAEAAQDPGTYLCILAVYQYRRSLSRKQHAEVRDCLEHAVANEPDDAQALAHLAMIYLDEYRYRYNPRPGADAVADATPLAERAVELAPESAVAFHALLTAHLFRRDLEAAFAAGARALANNPANPEIRAVYGLRLALAGRWQDGIPLVEQALANNPSPPGWYFFPLALNHYRQGEFDAALRAAHRIDMPEFVFTHLLLAAIQARRGWREAAGRAAVRATELAPDLTARLRIHLAQQVQDPELLEAWLYGLRLAGLETEAPYN